MLKILHTNLNLRIEKGKKNNDYVLGKVTAEKQLKYNDIDIFTNVEYMECENKEYHKKFSTNFKPIISTWKQNRGILCYIKKEIDFEEKVSKNNPHFLHFTIKKDEVIYNIIVFRILVSNSLSIDFIDRKSQFDTVLTYLDSNNDLENIILLGDWNHAKIRDVYDKNHPQYHFNYQYIRDELLKRNIEMGFKLKENHKENSYKGYLAIDHVAISNSLMFQKENFPKYSDYSKDAPIGIPDHASIICNIELKNE